MSKKTRNSGSFIKRSNSEATLSAVGIGGLLVGFIPFRVHSIAASDTEAVEGFVNMVLPVAVGILGYWFGNGHRKNDAGGEDIE